jgi:hypothetical protein
MAEVLSFAGALEIAQTYRKRHLLTGNGFSIACRPDIFVYGKLFERADFSRLSESARGVFDALGTTDFERVIRTLRDTSKLMHLYTGDQSIRERIQADAEGLREVLVHTIASSHPEMPSDIREEEYAACRRFLANFNTTYTLNYDLLLYWTAMHVPDGQSPSSDDGFRKPEDDYDAAYVVWEPDQSHDQNIWYLHGALHVFDAGTEVQKYTWVNTGVRLIEQIRDALRREYYPLFVAEGTSEEKLTRIRHSDYLAKGYRSFSSIQGALFIYGHSLAPSDEHYLRLVERGKLEHVFVGLHGDPASATNRATIRRANLLAERRKKGNLRVSFFDSGSANVWGS